MNDDHHYGRVCLVNTKSLRSRSVPVGIFGGIDSFICFCNAHGTQSLNIYRRKWSFILVGCWEKKASLFLADIVMLIEKNNKKLEWSKRWKNVNGDFVAKSVIASGSAILVWHNVICGKKEEVEYLIYPGIIMMTGRKGDNWNWKLSASSKCYRKKRMKDFEEIFQLIGLFPPFFIRERR